MPSQPLSALLAICFCISLAGGLAGAQVPRLPDLKPCPEAPRSSFRYVIARNEITGGLSYPGGEKRQFRGVDILLDTRSFSELNLKLLLEGISKRFPEPKELLVNVYTNLEDISTPEEGEYIATNCTFDLITPKYPWAFYMRNTEREKFIYHTKESGSVVITVMLRGKD